MLTMTERPTDRRLKLQYYGSGARPRFYDLYRLVHRQKQTVDDEGALEDGEFTPRRLFLRDMLARGLSPSPTMMRSRKDPYSLDLGELCFGTPIYPPSGHAHRSSVAGRA